jgi:hypothetical protein
LDNHDFIDLVVNLDKEKQKMLIAYLIGFYGVEKENEDVKDYRFDFKKTVLKYLEENN